MSGLGSASIPQRVVASRIARPASRVAGVGDLLRRRRDESGRRLEQFVGRARVLEEALGDEPLCIYVTGSYGRLEARVGSDPEHGSDLDLFFLYGGEDSAANLPRATWFRVAGRLIDLVQELGFPPLSGDAEYLEIHNSGRMRAQLGSRQDDSVNAFTARMLLLLESRPVVKAALYDQLMEEVVGFYFEDFDGHRADFRPTYLLNDILRFWRTLTLNYEHRRHARLHEAGGDEGKRQEAKEKTALQNLKLGFSRLSTCFSMVVPLAISAAPVTRGDVLALTEMSPTERWESIEDARVDALLQEYEWFLGVAGDEEAERAVVTDPDRREEARGREQRFGDLVFDLLLDRADRKTLRYVVV